MIASVQLLSLATASPRNHLSQDDVVVLATRLFSDRFPAFERMRPVFHNAGVRTRQVVMPIDWYLQPRSWPERSAVYQQAALELFCQATAAALDQAGVTGDAIDAIVTVSTTGISTPSLEARAMSRMGFRPDAIRVPVFGLGCAGGAAGLALATRLARSEPGARVLLVCVELCSVAFRLDDLSKADVISTAIFGDGAAACVLSSGEGGFARVTGSAEHTWPDSLDMMGWRVDPSGLGVVLALALPAFVARTIKPAMEVMLAKQSLNLEDVGRFVCHPGGVKVLEAVESAVGLGQGALDHEREVLADHGNMSSPSVLFVLDRARRAGLSRRSVVTAMGPGFTASTVTLEAA